MEYHGDKPSEEERKAQTPLSFMVLVLAVALICILGFCAALVWLVIVLH